MSATDSPNTGSGADTALSYDDGVAAIEGFLSRVPDGIEDNDDQDSAAIEESQTTEGQSEAGAKGEPEEDADDDLNIDLDDTEEDGKPAPDEPKIKAGQFAPPDAKVKLDDGTTISVADLIAGNMFQKTFTKKTTEHAEKVKAFEAERSEFAETKKQVEHQRNVILALTPKLLPKEPTPVDPNEDPAGYLAYLAERDAYQSRMAELQQLWQASQGEQTKSAEKQKKEQEAAAKKAEEELRTWAETESQKFYEAVPRLKDEAKRKEWASDLFEIGAKEYGLTEEEIAAIFDHRHLRIVTDAIAFRKAVAKRDAGQKAPPAQMRQPNLPAKQRMSQQTTQTREANVAADRLRKTGSPFDAVKALEKFV